MGVAIVKPANQPKHVTQTIKYLAAVYGGLGAQPIHRATGVWIKLCRSRGGTLRRVLFAATSVRPQLSSSTPSRLKPVQGRDPHSSVSALHMSQWPKDQQQRHADNDDKHFKWQAEFPVVTKTEAARPQDQGIVLVANWRQERAGGSDCDSHEKAVGIDAQC